MYKMSAYQICVNGDVCAGAGAGCGGREERWRGSRIEDEIIAICGITG